MLDSRLGQVYLFAVLDLYSRYVVHASIEKDQEALTAVKFMRTAFEKANLSKEQLQKLLIHSDNGSAMRSKELTGFMHDNGVQLSYSRPRHSNDNPHVESLFGSLKGPYLLSMRGCSTLQECNDALSEVIDRYNNERVHSAIHSTPYVRYQGKDAAYLAKNAQAYTLYCEQHPERFIKRQHRDFSPAGAQYLHVYEQMQHSSIAKAMRAAAHYANKQERLKQQSC